MTLISILLVLFFVFFFFFFFSIIATTLTKAHCLPAQQHALIQFKQGFNTTELHSWNSSTDCCIWDGITCDEQTGMVTALNLTDRSISGEINLALFNLRSLRYLNHAYKNFYNISLPQTGFERLANLTYLDLSYSGFAGEVPITISSLTNLISLDLSNDNKTLFLHDTGLKTLLSNLSKLEVLRLDGVDISLNGDEWGKAVFQAGPTLQELSMADCGLRGNLPNEIFHLTNLTELGLSNNPMLLGKLPEFPKQSFLQYLYLGSTNLTGPLPDSIGNLQNISELDLPYCNFYGVIPSSISSLTNIYSLYLSNNSLTGESPFSICNVKVLDLSFNNLTGTIPPCFVEDAELKVIINLKSNKLSGPLPQNISQPCGLQVIDLNGNLINGSLPELLFYCNALNVLDLGNNQIMNRFPNWLENLENLRVLVLRSKVFYGNISDMEIKTKVNDSCFLMLNILDVSSNHFSGTLPKNIFVNLKAMIGVSNRFSGNASSIPNLASITQKGLSFDLSSSLDILCLIDMSNNEFWGKMPEEIGQLKLLDMLNLSHNALTGPIPQEFANLQQLELLDLSSNQLSGHIPQQLTSLTFLSALNLSCNNLVGEIPEAPQFSTFSNASYLGNPGLCGEPLSLHCPTPSSNHVLNNGLSSKVSTAIIGFSISIGLWLGVGFALVI